MWVGGGGGHDPLYFGMDPDKRLIQDVETERQRRNELPSNLYK